MALPAPSSQLVSNYDSFFFEFIFQSRIEQYEQHGPPTAARGEEVHHGRSSPTVHPQSKAKRRLRQPFPLLLIELNRIEN